MFAGFLAAGSWTEERGDNILDTGAPWYNVYETKDGKYVSIGSIETRFYEELLQKLERAGPRPARSQGAGRRCSALFAKTFKTKTRDEWCKVFEGSDACFAPVLSWSEARRDAHNVARKVFIEVASVEQPSPAPRFSRTPGAVRRAPPERGEGGRASAARLGLQPKPKSKADKRGLGTRE